MKLESLFDIDSLNLQLEKLDKEAQNPNLWNDNEKAQKTLIAKKEIENTLTEYNRLLEKLDELEELYEMVEELGDKDGSKIVSKDFIKLKEDIENFNIKALLTEEYDSNNAILSIHAGTGGVDAMDWTAMLLRLYTRWSEKQGYKVNITEYQQDTEAGIKRATAIISGVNAYGYLKSEKGVHRLVRISPFNAAAKRQTSFAFVDILPQVDLDDNIEIKLDEIKIDTYRSSGAGGQSVNTTDSAIRITHIPTNIVVTCQNERSQHRNKEVAMSILASKLIKLKEQEHQENLDELRGDFSSNSWGSQIRSYVFHPYNMVKDHRTGAETSNVSAVMDGDIDYFINEKLKGKTKEN